MAAYYRWTKIARPAKTTLCIMHIQSQCNVLTQVLTKTQNDDCYQPLVGGLLHLVHWWVGNGHPDQSPLLYKASFRGAGSSMDPKYCRNFMHNSKRWKWHKLRLFCQCQLSHFSIVFFASFTKKLWLFGNGAAIFFILLFYTSGRDFLCM